MIKSGNIWFTCNFFVRTEFFSIICRYRMYLVLKRVQGIDGSFCQGRHHFRHVATYFETNFFQYPHRSLNKRFRFVESDSRPPLTKLRFFREKTAVPSRGNCSPFERKLQFLRKGTPVSPRRNSSFSSRELQFFSEKNSATSRKYSQKYRFFIFPYLSEPNIAVFVAVER